MPIKKNVTLVTKYKQVPAGKREHVEFETEDGRTFFSEKEANDYQGQLDAKRLWDNISVKYFSDDLPTQIPQEWRYATTQEELESIKTRFGYYDSKKANDLCIDDVRCTDKKPDLKLDIWYGYCYEDGGDYKGTNRIYTLDYIRNTLQNSLDRVKEL